MDKFLIDVANRLEKAVSVVNSEIVQDELDSIQASILDRVESEWGYDIDSESYYLKSDKNSVQPELPFDENS